MALVSLHSVQFVTLVSLHFSPGLGQSPLQYSLWPWSAYTSVQLQFVVLISLHQYNDQVCFYSRPTSKISLYLQYFTLHLKQYYLFQTIWPYQVPKHLVHTFFNSTVCLFVILSSSLASSPNLSCCSFS